MTEGIVLVVHVRPGSSRDAIDGSHDDVLAVRVIAPPADGKANKAVCRVIATAFGVRPSAVSLVGGATSRRKRVRVDGDTAELMSIHDRLLASPG